MSAHYPASPRNPARAGAIGIVESIGWIEATEDKPPRFGATVLFPAGPQDISAAVVWKSIPVRIVVAADYDEMVAALRRLRDANAKTYPGYGREVEDAVAHANSVLAKAVGGAP